MGRVPSADLTRRVCRLVEQGVPPQVAARALDISDPDFELWMKSDSKFREAVQKAEAKAETEIIGEVRKAAKNGNTLAAQWLAERRWPDRYLRKSVNAPTESPKPEKQDPFETLDNVVRLPRAG